MKLDAHAVRRWHQHLSHQLFMGAAWGKGRKRDSRGHSYDTHARWSILPAPEQGPGAKASHRCEAACSIAVWHAAAAAGTYRPATVRTSCVLARMMFP